MQTIERWRRWAVRSEMAAPVSHFKELKAF